MDRMKDGKDGVLGWLVFLLHGVRKRESPTTLPKSRSSAAIQVKRLFFSPAENELLPVLGVRLIERLEH